MPWAAPSSWLISSNTCWTCPGTTHNRSPSTYSRRDRNRTAPLRPFVILSFPQRWESDIVYLEGFTGSRFLEDPGQFQVYSRLFRCLMMKDSLRSPGSRKLIERYLATYRKGV
ncbi:Scr1 family TA system antitoxin-like transcriptional regulator [Streptomyces niveiscabiei]|nr:Scr1 family TA system antitoxin-like transcriptional regulator [Streptomyces niveiscabiei]MDX3385695.1 Scr1 family TA system antitoxin-like transcriptional regulator [Streptomyces niveiscabiei]